MTETRGPQARERTGGGVTLAQIFAAGLAGAAALLGTLFVLVHRSSRAAIVEATERLCATASLEIERRAEGRLRVAEDAIGEFEAESAGGLVDPRDADSVGRALIGAALRKPAIAEIAYTYGTQTGRDAEGRAVLAPEGRGQVSVERRPGREGLVTCTTVADGAHFRATASAVGTGGGTGVDTGGVRGGAATVVETIADVPDPTTHPTFVTPLREPFDGSLVWTDLSWSQLDAKLEPAARRVVVAAQKAVRAGDAGPSGARRVGVLRVSIDTQGLDAITDLRLGGDAGGDERTFLCDLGGRLIAPVGPGGHFAEVGDDLRVPADAIPAPIARCLAIQRDAGQAAREAGLERAARVERFEMDGRPYLVAFQPLAVAQQWMVGVLVPEDAFTGDLERERRRLLFAALGVMLLFLAGGAVALRAAGRSFGAIVAETSRMGAFDFAATERASPVREVQSVLDGLERAKAALRALGKFVPVDLVRRLYADGGDPHPGGEMREVSILFSDIEGFTSFAESMGPNDLAVLMGGYFAAMTSAIHATHGIVDKFIGDAVMALWNAPEATPGHAAMACRAALACREAERALLASPGWAGRARIRTRFGVHTGTVMVGNVGAPDRLNFTALGDGVNLASRLESLNKHYGTTILVSEAVVAAAAPAAANGTACAPDAAFAFRLVDRVAVKGKAQGVRIFELRGTGPGPDAVAAAYDAAFGAYLRRDFAAARDLFAALPDDGPSRVLQARCVRFLASPPPADWDGTFAWTEK